MQASLQQRSVRLGASSRQQGSLVAAPSSRVGSRAAAVVPQQLSASAPRLVAAAAAATESASPAAAKAPAAPGKPSLHNQPAPDTYAIVEVAGKQMFVEPGKWYVCNRLKVDVGDKIRLGRVLALKQGNSFSVGKPYLEGVNIEAEVLEEFRGPKLIVYKMKPKKHYRRKNGHRQELTKFKVTTISA